MPQHIHVTADGLKTSIEVVDPENAGFHWHTVNGERTSIDEFGEGHTHIFAAVKTTGPIDIEDEDNSNQEPKSLAHSQQGKITECKQIDRNGIQVGIVEGYIATWDIDRGDFFGVKDRFVKGAFRDSLADLASRQRNIRLKDHHMRTIGIFPIQNALEDDRGLFAIGEINLEVQQGKEAHVLALQKALTDFSIGFTAEEFHMDGDIRVITKATIWEGSIVDEPMNPAAQITQVKKKFNASDIDKMTPRELEKALKANGFSDDAAKMIVKQQKENQKKDDSDLIESLKMASKAIKQRESNQELIELLKKTATAVA